MTCFKDNKLANNNQVIINLLLFLLLVYIIFLIIYLFIFIEPLHLKKLILFELIISTL